MLFIIMLVFYVLACYVIIKMALVQGFSDIKKKYKDPKNQEALGEITFLKFQERVKEPLDKLFGVTDGKKKKEGDETESLFKRKMDYGDHEFVEEFRDKFKFDELLANMSGNAFCIYQYIPTQLAHMATAGLFWNRIEHIHSDSEESKDADGISNVETLGVSEWLSAN